MPRCCLVVFACISLLLSACAGRSHTTAGARSINDVPVVVFSDGFHSGFLIPLRPESAFLDPQTAGEPATWPVVEIGFGADAWVNARDPGALAGLSLILSSSQAVLMGEHRQGLVRPPRDRQHPVRTWGLTFDAVTWQRFLSVISQWVDQEVVQLRRPEQPAFMRFSTRSWSSFRTCNDFVAEVLRDTGLPIGPRLIRTNAPFTEQMDALALHMASRSVATIVAATP